MTFKALAGAALAAASLLLSSCMLLPGKFGSELTLRTDGTFAFSYKGDIHLITLSKLAADAAKGEQRAGKPSYEPQPCYDETTIEERKCTANELGRQKSDWEASQTSGADKSTRDAEMMKTMMGGIDPGDPKAAEEFASRLGRQVGWRSVIHRGDGRFEVDFAITGRLDHDFTFPTIEKMPVVSPFVTAIRRADGSVRIEAPAFAAGNNSPSPMMGMMGAMADSGANSGAKSGSNESLPGMPVLDGTFAVITDGEVLANNTDEGPEPTTIGTGTGTGKRLDWKVNPRTTAAPTALVKLR